MFSGELLPGLSVEIAAQLLASQLGIADPTRLLPLFSGQPVTLRRNLSVPEARKQFLALRKAGLRVYLQASSNAANTLQPESHHLAIPVMMAPIDTESVAAPAGAAPVAAQSDKQTRRNALEGLAYAALIAAGLVILRLALLPPVQPSLQVLAAGTDAQQRLWVLDNRQLHRLTRADEIERSETLPDDWISDGMSPVLAVLNDNSVLLNGRRETGWTLLRCSLTAPAACAALPLAPSFTAAPGFAVQPLSGEIVAIDYARNEILLLDEQGAVLAHAEHAATESSMPVIQQGLLYMSSATTAGLDVLSIDRESFGQQLDQLLIEPDFVTDSERVAAAVTVDAGWWLLLRDTAADNEAMHHRLISVDPYLAKPRDLPLAATRPRALIKQGPRVLVLDADQETLAQLSLSGQVGKAVAVAAIAGYNRDQREQASTARWQLGLAAAVLLLAALGAGLSLVWPARRTRP